MTGNDLLIGKWKRVDVHIVEFRKAKNGEYEGYIIDIGLLGKYHFKNEEKTFNLKKVNNSNYKGTVKWRYTDGRQKWKPTTQIINNDKMSGSGKWEKID